MAEALLRHHLAAVGVEATVRSCGLLESGRAVTAEGVEVLLPMGIDNSAHVSTTLSPELVGQADLVIAMTREHLREAVLACPPVWTRAFTLKELVRRGEQAGWRTPSESVDDWLVRVGSGRTRADLLGSSREDDVADPMGMGLLEYERTRDQLDDLIQRLVALCWKAPGMLEAQGREA